MKPLPNTFASRFLCFIFFAFLIVISCAKDNEIFENPVLDKSETTVEASEKDNGEDEKKEVITEEISEKKQEEDPIDAMAAKTYETRTIIFPAINDAHIQGTTGYNQNIVRLEEGRRTSYLMVDLSPIGSIGGTVNASNLEFTIDTDDGKSTVSVFKSFSNDWKHEELSAGSASSINLKHSYI